jgi:aldose 1-epimerase
LVFNLEFALVERSDSRVVLEASCRDESAYPFDVTVRVEYELTDEGLRSSLSAENHSNVPTPVAVGAHPYLVVDADSRLRVEAAQRIEVDTRMLPTGVREVENQVFAITPADRSDFTDACFTELNFASGWATTVLTRPSMQADVVIAQSAEFTHLQVFTLQGGFGGHAGLLALEPQTAAGNALNHLDRVPVLKPGETQISEWSISLRNSFHD